MGLAECPLMVLIALLVLAVPGLLIAIIYMLRKNKKDTDTDTDTATVTDTDTDTAGSRDLRSNTSNKPTEI